MLLSMLDHPSVRFSMSTKGEIPLGKRFSHKIQIIICSVRRSRAHRSNVTGSLKKDIFRLRQGKIAVFKPYSLLGIVRSFKRNWGSYSCIWLPSVIFVIIVLGFATREMSA